MSDYVSEVANATRTLRSWRRSRRARFLGLISVLCFTIACSFLFSLIWGRTFVSFDSLVLMATGAEDQSGSFIVERLRLPRALLCLLVGMSFGMAGAAFQTMLDNPLASPDIIGINAGASAAAVFAIVILSKGGLIVSTYAIIFSLLIATLIYVLSIGKALVSARIILVGIGVAAFLNSAIAYMLSQALVWDLQEAIRWLAGSVNGATYAQAMPVTASLLIFGGFLIGQSRNLEVLRLGEPASVSLGVNLHRSRVLVSVSAVGLIAFATAATGPVSFVAFIAGTMGRTLLGAGRSPIVLSGLIGALLVLSADIIGQNAFSNRYPVGVVTAALGAPFLIYLIIRKSGRGELI